MPTDSASKFALSSLRLSWRGGGGEPLRLPSRMVTQPDRADLPPGLAGSLKFPTVLGLLGGGTI